jgi:riboflavin biosynthesis pyrimidine reductase
VSAQDGHLEPRAIVQALFARGFHRILIEGGARTISNFIDADCVDRLHILQAPVLIGSGKMGLELEPQGELARARRPYVETYPLTGGDVLFDCALR